MKVFPWLKRWVPLLSVAFLVAVTLLRAVGEVQAATAIETSMQFLGLVVTDPETASGVGAGVGVLLKMVGMFRKARKGDDFVPPRRFAAALGVCVVGLTMAACSEDSELPTAPPTQVTVNVNNNQNQGTGNQSPEGPGNSCEAVRYVELSASVNGTVVDHLAPGQTVTVTARALSASRAPITEGRCLPAPTWAKTGQCDLAGDAAAFSRPLTGRSSGSGTCSIEVSVSEAQGLLALAVR